PSTVMPSVSRHLVLRMQTTTRSFDVAQDDDVSLASRLGAMDGGVSVFLIQRRGPDFNGARDADDAPGSGSGRAQTGTAQKVWTSGSPQPQAPPSLNVTQKASAP